jgi:hypothetical protein
MQKINKVVAAKLCRLSLFLHRACEEFEKIAKKIKDKNIKMSIREVALETNQYKHELNAQLVSLSIKDIDISDSVDTGDVIKNSHLNNKIITDKEVLELCCKSEVYFEKAYRDVLNEYFPFKGLRSCK